MQIFHLFPSKKYTLYKKYVKLNYFLNYVKDKITWMCKFTLNIIVINWICFYLFYLY